MILALISDVHGNLEALTAVMDDIGEHAPADEIIFLGDAVGYGANPNETVQLIDARCQIKLMGNHDYSALGLLDPSEFNSYAQSGISYSVSVLTEESRRTLASFQMVARKPEALFVHATPDKPDDWNYCLSVPEAARQFKAFAEPVCFIGHSHQPIIFVRDSRVGTRELDEDDFCLENNCRYLINVGSVGQPRDGDPRSCYVIYDTNSRRLTYRRVRYDVVAAQKKMKNADLPAFLIDRLAVGR